MELHAFNRVLLVSHAHDYATAVGFPSFGADLKLRREIQFLNNQRMVAGCGHRLGSIAEDGAAIVLNAAGLAVHYVLGANHITAKGGANGLMSQADAEDRLLAG